MHNPRVRPLSSLLYTCITFLPQSAAFLRRRPPTRSRNHYKAAQLICRKIGDHAASKKKKKHTRHFSRAKLIYSISRFACSISISVFNVNPQSGADLLRGLLLTVQVKNTPIERHKRWAVKCKMRVCAAFLYTWMSTLLKVK